MRPYFFHITIIIFLSSASALSQNNQNSISLFGSYTLSSKVYHSYGEGEPARRNQFFTITDIFGIGGEFRHEFSNLSLQIGISIEYLETRRNFDYFLSPSSSLPITDGYRALPLEITGYFLIPIGLQKWKFSLGAGFGFYWGTREFSYGSIHPKTVERKIGAGIHIVTNTEFLVSKSIGLRTGLKFREVQFWNTDRFSDNDIIDNQRIAELLQENLKSRILIDGMLFYGGIVYYFNG